MYMYLRSCSFNIVGNRRSDVIEEVPKVDEEKEDEKKDEEKPFEKTGTGNL